MERTIADRVFVFEEPTQIPVDFGTESCALAITSNPWGEDSLARVCLVVLASWLPVQAPIGMFVTIRLYNPGGVSAAEVDVVYATAPFRSGSRDRETTRAVAIGRWMRETGFLTHHSPDRNDGGDRWARAVGGQIPERDQRGRKEDTLRSAKRAVERLNRRDWPTPDEWIPWPPPGWVPLTELDRLSTAASF